MTPLLRLCAVAIALALGPSAANAAASTLAETSEIVFCSGQSAPYTGCVAADLRAKADTLASPAAIFEYVHNQSDFILYHGAHSGSANTFLGARGNDVDLAATLIAMLRSQGIPARYVVGTVRVPATRVANWLQVEDTTLAKSLLVDQGIQGVKSSTSGATATLDFEHVWVEALVPYGQYRGDTVSSTQCGATPTPAACHWVPLDPSWKQYQQVSSGLDPYASLSFDYTAYYNAILNADATRMNRNPLEIYQEQVLSWLGTNAPGKTLKDIPDFRGIVVETNGLLPASLPYAVVSTTARNYNALADHDAAVPAAEPKKWGKSVSVALSLTYTGGSGPVTLTPAATSAQLTDLATQRFTVATEADSYGVPSLVVRLGGTVLATPISLAASGGYFPTTGDPFTLNLTMDGTPDPTGGTNDLRIQATYQGVVGGYYLIAAGGESSNWSQVHRAAQQLLAANNTYTIYYDYTESGCDSATGLNCTPYVFDRTHNPDLPLDTRLVDYLPAMDDLTGGLLYVASTQYYAKLMDALAALDGINKVKTPITGFLGVVSSSDQTTEYLQGDNSTAFSILPGGLLIDMKGISVAGSWRINAPATTSSTHFALFGHITSSLEHETWQELTGYDAISTVRGIQMALANGATLLDLKKNSATDNVQTMYAPMGFTSTAPSGFTLNRRAIYTTMMDSWSYATTDGSQQFTILEKQPASASDARAPRLTYFNSYFDSDLSCFHSIQNQLASLLATYGANAALNAGSLCISAFPTGTTIAAAIALNKSDYASYRINNGVASFDYLDENKGFSSANFVYRTVTNAANDAHSAQSVQDWRDILYLTDQTKGWAEVIVPSKLSVGPTFRFAVNVLKTYDTANTLNSASFEIRNMWGASAGGGFVMAPAQSSGKDKPDTLSDTSGDAQ